VLREFSTVTSRYVELQMSAGINTLQGSLLSLRKKKVLPPPPTGAEPINKNDFVTLISKEGHVFILERKCACVSKLIRAYVGTPSNSATEEPQDSNLVPAVSSPDVTWDATSPSVVRFPFIAANHLEKAVQYFYYRVKYENNPDQRTDFHVAPEMALDLIKVATLLQC
jgi:transcription elongation factor B subunit 1